MHGQPAMEFPLTLVDLGGCVALLLWGVHMVRTGVQRAFGARLRQVLDRALRTRMSALLAGVGVTAVLQSSTATGLMVSGFAAAGVVDLVPALAVMLGANIGTTLIVQALSFDVSAISPAFVLLGVMMFRRGQTGTRDLGRVFIGLGLMLLALRQLLELVTPYEDTPSLRLLLGAVSTEPFLDVVLAAGLTWAAHSSAAVVLLIMSLAAKGVVPPQAAFALVLGANIGSAINPVMEGGAGDDPVARRVPLGNLLNRLIGAAAALLLLPPLARWIEGWEPTTERAVADFHTLFNVALAAAFFPVLPAFATLLRKLLPARIDPADPARPIYLDPCALEAPVVALGCAAREALRLSDVLETMLQGAREALVSGDRRKLAAARRVDDVLDKLNTSIKAYLSRLDDDALAAADHRRVAEILCFATNIEHAGDTIERGVLAQATRMAKRGVALPPDQQQEVARLMDRLSANLRTAGSLFITEDLRVARLLAAEKEVFRDLEASATAGHFEALREGRAAAASTGSQHLDLMRDLKTINTHIVAAAAYPVLERHGELLPSRMRGDDVTAPMD